MSYPIRITNTVLESQNSLQTTVHPQNQTQYINPPVQHRSFHFSPRLAIEMVQNILTQHFRQLFHVVTVNGFSPRHPFGNGNKKRPVHNLHRFFNVIHIGLKKNTRPHR